MIYLQLLCLATLLSFVLIAEIRSLASPSLLLLGGFSISTLFAAAYNFKWRYEYSVVALLYVIFGITAFMLGEFMVDALYQKYTTGKLSRHRTDIFLIRKPLSVSMRKLLLIEIYDVIMTYLYYRDVKAISRLYGNTGSELWQIVSYFRKASAHGEYRLSRNIVLMNSFSRYIAYMFIFMILYNKIIARKKVNPLYFLPILSWFPSSTLSGARGSYLCMTCFTFVVFVVLYQSRHTMNITSMKTILKYAIVAFAVLLVVFQSVGTLKRSGANEDVMEHIAKYAGFSIPAFSQYVENPWPEDKYFGEYTLNRVYSILNGVGLAHVKTTDRVLPMTNLPGGIIANVYTAFLRYVQDYGAIGFLAIMFLVSLVYSFAKWFVYKRGSALWLILYATFLYPVPQMSVEEMLFNELISTSLIYTPLLIILAAWFLFGKNFKRITW